MVGAFVEQTRTLAVGPHGAKILLTRMLVPDQKINILCLATGRASVGRVVGQIGGGPEGHYYGIELLDTDANLAVVGVRGFVYPDAEGLAETLNRGRARMVRGYSLRLYGRGGLVSELR